MIVELILGKYFWRLYLVFVTLLAAAVVVCVSAGHFTTLGIGALAGGSALPAARRWSRRLGRRRAARRLAQTNPDS
jgi:hypothetical protein